MYSLGLCCHGFGGDRSDLHARMKVSPRGEDPSLHAQKTYTPALTGSIRDPLRGGNGSQVKSWGGCRRQPRGAQRDPGSGTQNGFGASGHLSPETQQHKTCYSPKHERFNQGICLNVKNGVNERAVSPMTWSLSYPAGVFYDFWLEFSSQLEHLPAPGFEPHGALSGQLILG